MGPKKKDVKDVPSLADRIKASNNSPLEPTKRLPNGTRQVDRETLVKKFIRLYCRELAIRPLMIQAVEEARATNREIIKIYEHIEKTTSSQQTPTDNAIEINKRTLPIKGGKSKKESTRRLGDIDTNETSLADLVNGLNIENNKGHSSIIKDTEEPHSENVNVLSKSEEEEEFSSKISVKSFDSNVKNRLIVNETKCVPDINDELNKQMKYNTTNLVFKETENPKNETSLNDNCEQTILHSENVKHIDDSAQQIRNPSKENLSNITTTPSLSASRSKHPLVPRYKAVCVSSRSTNIGRRDKTSDTNEVDNLEQSENGRRPISSTSTATVLPLSETDEGASYTTDEIASSSQASPDVLTNMADSSVPLNLRNTPHTLRALSFPESKTPYKFTEYPSKGHCKQGVLTENYFSDTPVSMPRNTHQGSSTLHTKLNKSDANYNRKRIEQVIDGQTRNRHLQNQLQKFGGGNFKRSQKHSVSSETTSIHINPRTALNGRFLTLSDDFSPKTDPYHEFPKKLGWFLKSGELEYDERFTFDDKRQTKSKAYMKVQRQHYKSRTMDVVPQSNNWKIQTEPRREKRHDLYTSSRPFYNQTPRKPLITNRVRFKKGVMTKPLLKRKPFITVV